MREKPAEKVIELDEVSTRGPRQFWTNRSVLKLAEGSDPVDTIVRTARAIVLDAMETGWSGPPFDPFQLASHMGIAVTPKDDIPDARLVPAASGGVYVEFNPNHSPVRIRFSLAHELAHTLFRDHAEAVRKRGQPTGDEWQLELLCNLAAAEFLMPIGTAGELEKEPIDIENLIRLRKTFDVSTEALFLRMVKLTSEPCAVFAAARMAGEGEPTRFRIDYVIPSRSWRVSIPKELEVTGSTALADCTAVGFTSKGRERWSASVPELTLECVGAPAYPGELYPRVVGILRKENGPRSEPRRLIEVRGDATQPRGPGRIVIAHVVNDKTPNWGAGFPRALRMRYPAVQEDFMQWAGERRANLALGNSHVTRVSENLSVFQMVAQHGYGPSSKPRIRYQALRKCLEQLAAYAHEQSASAHMPLIGTGQAGGQWGVIRELIDETLVRGGVEVTVYHLPEAERPREVQRVFSSRIVEPY